MARTVYHESRHAEQWFRMARVEAGKGKNGAQISSALGIKRSVADEAAKGGRFDSPAAIHFFVDRGPERPLTCLVVAKIEEGEAGISDGVVKELAVRLDPR